MLWLGSPAVQMLPHCSISCSLQSWMKQSVGECLTKQNHFFHHHPALPRTPASPCYRTPKVPLLRDLLKENSPANVTFQYICSVEMSHPVICSVRSKDWPVHFSNYIQQCPHTNKQTKSNRTVTVFCDIWTVRGGGGGGGVATVLFSLLSCSPLFQLLREIQFPNGPQAGSDKRIIYNSTQLPGFKNLQHQQKTSLVQHQLNIYNYQTKPKLPQGKKMS